MMVSRRAALFGVSALIAFPATCGAQEQALKIVYAFPPGGAADAVARLIADRLQRDLRRSVIVENKSGAAGRIGARAVKDAPADGSVVLFAVSSQLTIQPHLATDTGYDPFADFAPISQVVAFDQAVAVAANSPVRSVRELVAWYKANPDQAIYGSPGVGTGPHLVALEFARALGLELRHVAYRGTATALPDLFTGRIPGHFAASAELIEHHAGGKIRILADRRRRKISRLCRMFRHSRKAAPISTQRAGTRCTRPRERRPIRSGNSKRRSSRSRTIPICEQKSWRPDSARLAQRPTYFGISSALSSSTGRASLPHRTSRARNSAPAEAETLP